MRKWIKLLCLLTVMLAGAPAVAATQTSGSLEVKLEAGDLAVVNGAVTLYQVGTRTENGYRITDGFGGGILKPEDTDSDRLAQWLAETVTEAGISMLLDADGQAVFSDLEEGLYMLVQTERIDGFYPINPILLTIPQEEQWNVTIHRYPVPVVTELPQTGQSPLLFFGILGMVLSGAGLLLCIPKNRKP